MVPQQLGSSLSVCLPRSVSQSPPWFLMLRVHPASSCPAPLEASCCRRSLPPPPPHISHSTRPQSSPALPVFSSVSSPPYFSFQLSCSAQLLLATLPGPSAPSFSTSPSPPPFPPSLLPFALLVYLYTALLHSPLLNLRVLLQIYLFPTT